MVRKSFPFSLSVSNSANRQILFSKVNTAADFKSPWINTTYWWWVILMCSLGFRSKLMLMVICSLLCLFVHLCFYNICGRKSSNTFGYNLKKSLVCCSVLFLWEYEGMLLVSGRDLLEWCEVSQRLLLEVFIILYRLSPILFRSYTVLKNGFIEGL